MNTQQKDQLFYLQDSRSYVGNDMLFWASYGGYTTDISKAAKYTLAESQSMHESRNTDIPWPCEYIDTKTRPAVDMQYVKRADVARCGIKFVKPKKPKAETFRCYGCGRFMRIYDYYGGPCDKCDTDNRP